MAAAAAGTSPARPGLQTPAAVWNGGKLDRGGGSKATEPLLSVFSPRTPLRRRCPRRWYGSRAGIGTSDHAKVLGKPGNPQLAIYSHMINAFLYLYRYPIGRLSAFQLEE